MATLTVTRTSEKDIPQRPIFIEVDGQFWAKLEFGDTVSREVPEGSHQLRLPRPVDKFPTTAAS